MKHRMSLIVLAMCSHAQAVEYQLPTNETTHREQSYQIRTIMFDVVTPTQFLRPGKLLEGNGDVNLHYRKDSIWREDLVDGTEDEGSRGVMDVTLRSKVWRLQTEVIVGIVNADSNGGTDITSVNFWTVFPLYQERYRGASIAIGAGFSGGEGESLDLNFKDTEKYQLEYRMTEHIGLHVFHINLGASHYKGGTNIMDISRTTTKGDVIPAGAFVNDFIGMNAGLAWTWRYNRFIRNGIEAYGTWYDWDGETETLKDRQIIMSLFTEMNFGHSSALRLGLGFEPDRDTDEDRDESLVYDVSLFTRF